MSQEFTSKIEIIDETNYEITLTNIKRFWDRDGIEFVSYLLSHGIITKIHEMDLDRNSELVTLATPLMAITKKIKITGISPSSSQWQEMADKFGGETEHLTFWSGTGSGYGASTVNLDKESGPIVARLMSKVKFPTLRNVGYGDFLGFLGALEENLGEEGVRCEKITISWDDWMVEDDDDADVLRTYKGDRPERQEIEGLLERLVDWQVEIKTDIKTHHDTESFGGYIYITKK